jgi:hypothetical protein
MLSDIDLQTNTNFDFEKFKQEAIKGLSEGKKLGGVDGVFSPMISICWNPCLKAR